MTISKSYTKIYDTIRRIPYGRVATYGQIALLSGIGRNARIIGYALAKLASNNDIPWHRVINRHGKISYSVARNSDDYLQKELLKKEGIKFNKENCIDLKKYQWNE